MKKFSGKIKDWFVRHKPTKRRLIQVYAALLYNANIKGFVTGNIYKGNSKYMCVPGFNCYSCPAAVGACPLGSLQNALANSGTRAPFYVLGILILFGLLLGRTICCFLCPFGLLQDLLYKIKSPKLKKSKVTRVLSYFKYFLLVAFVIILPIVYTTTVPAFCKYLCPFGVIEGAIALFANPSTSAATWGLLAGVFAWKFCLMVLIVAGCIFVYRLFCRFICPLGAIYSFFCRIAMIGIKLDKQKCVDCGLCIQTCKMDIKHVGDHECINCGDCLKVCPTHAISWKGSKIFLHPNAIEEGGESAQGEKVPLTSLLASSTAKGGTIAINAGGVPLNNTAENTAVKESVAVNETVTANEVQENIAETEVKEPAAEKPQKIAENCLRIFYIYNKNGIWLVKSAGEVKTFKNRIFALQYVQEAAKEHSAMVYAQRQDGTFALNILKGKTYEEAESTVAVNGAVAGVENKQPAVSDNKPENEAVDNAQNGAVKAETADGGQADVKQPAGLSRAEIKAKKKAYHKTIAYQKKRNKVLEICAWAVALVVLATALIYYNFIVKDVEADYVYSVGETYHDFTSQKFFGEDGDTYTLQDDLDDNKIVILNFWYIGCGGCEEEIPYFGELAQDKDYSDKVSVVVIHEGDDPIRSTALTKSGTAYYIENYITKSKKWDFYESITWTIDTEDTQYFLELGGTNGYPITAILDSNGVIQFMTEGSMNKTKIYSEVDRILALND